ncbi:hypothetical protein HYH02_008433 [Chlamydomonas schloesseri]|uniref:Uncharacterized protein n=1 Tax=Chlamydomonas schloesseri TaxID=2026947 RepID=A0A835WFH7_9CHLO|nr:hypothetical protein HYH02_008433 [Chlamydomonas schloesseri]|eukprot:KAG2446441.1 hypothetical protein HYH02_008433 [Chlamydomonas schloesseri]
MSGRALLSRYRSAAGLSPPRASPAAVARTGNPVQEWDSAAEYRAERLADFVAARRAAPQGPSGGSAMGASSQEAPRHPLRTSFRVWDGPLAGIAHVEGQFSALDEGPAGDAVAQSPPPDDLAEALATDLEALAAAAQPARHVVYDISGSESDYGLLPIILEPRVACSSSSGSSDTGAAGAGSSSAVRAVGQGIIADARTPGRAGGCGWWSLAEAAGAPLTWAEVAESLGVAAPELVAALAPPTKNVFHDREAFWRHMWERHISPLDGGTSREGAGGSGGGDEGAVQPPPLASIAAVEASAAAAAGGNVNQGASGAVPSSAAAMADVVRRFIDAVQWPGDGTGAGAGSAAGGGGGAGGPQQAAAVLQVHLGSEALGWNPIPLLWLGRSRRSGAILGLMTAVVWT